MVLTMPGTQLQFPISRADHTQEGTCPTAAVRHTLVLSVPRPQHGWEFHMSQLSPSAAVQVKPGPLTDQTHINPFFHCRATTLRKLSSAEEDFGFTARTQCRGRAADKTLCLGKCSIKLWLCCLYGCVMSSKGFDRWLCCEKGGTLVLAASQPSHFASLKKMFLCTEGKQLLFPLGDGGMGMKKHNWELQPIQWLVCLLDREPSCILYPQVPTCNT